jgi:hypothetical protein
MLSSLIDAMRSTQPHIIDQNMYVQFGENRNQFVMMQHIVDHNTDYHAVECSDMYIKHGSNKQVRKTTTGWYLCV